MKAYCIGGPMDMQVVDVKEDMRTVCFATSGLLPRHCIYSAARVDAPPEPVMVTHVVYRMVYRSRDGKRAVYVAEEAL